MMLCYGLNNNQQRIPKQPKQLRSTEMICNLFIKIIDLNRFAVSLDNYLNNICDGFKAGSVLWTFVSRLDLDY